MPKIVVIEKSGTVKTVLIKDFSESTLYKKVGLKSGDGFVLQHTWGTEDGLDQSIKLYAKKVGKAGQENKYDFPPPADGLLFFGNCVLVNKTADGVVSNLSPTEWQSVYRKLFGGFHDLDVAHSSSEDELDTDEELARLKESGENVKLTKAGYIDDGFVVDESEEIEDASSESSEDEVIAKKKVSKKTKPDNTKASSSEETVENYLDCTRELEEEEYIELLCLSIAYTQNIIRLFVLYFVGR
jgi:hypothetical protein